MILIQKGTYTLSETESNSDTQVYTTCTRSHLNVLLGRRNLGKIQSPCLLLEGSRGGGTAFSEITCKET